MNQIQIVILVASLAAGLAEGQGQTANGALQTGASALSSAADGGSRYFAPDGPIQPALTAIAGLPMRGAELANSGITRLSNGMDNMARRMGGGEIKSMPGLSALSSLTSGFSSITESLQNMIRQKNNFIRNQAHRGVEAADRLRSSMEKGRSSMSGDLQGSLNNAVNMVGSTMSKTMGNMQGFSQKLQQGAEKLVSSASQSVGGMQGNMMGQAQGLVGTIRKHVERGVSNIQQTGQELMGHMDKGMKQNMNHASGMIGNMHGHMQGVNNLGKDMINTMQGDVAGVIGQVQQAGQKTAMKLQQKKSTLINSVSSIAGSMGGQKGGY